MEENAENEIASGISAPKRSRSNDELKDIPSSSCSSDPQSPCDNRENNALNNNNNNISDSGMSLKMEESSDMIMTVDSNINGTDGTISTVSSGCIPQEESMESLGTKEDNTNSLGEVETPCSSNMIKSFKRNRSRNYRSADRSSSASSSHSLNGEEAVAQDTATQAAPAKTEEVRTDAEGLSPSHVFHSTPESRDSSVSVDVEVRDISSPSESSELSSPDGDSDDDDDTDFSPIFGDRQSPDYLSPDSTDSARIKEKDEEVNKLLNKPKPSYTWNATYELRRREHGLSGDGRTSLRNGFTYGFNNRFYASRHIVERMKLSHVLRKHNGCVNCLNFNKSGDLLVTGSDDARLIIWDWAGNKVKHIWKSGHSSNIFQSKFVPTSACLDIISAARDGRVRRSIVPSAGGKVLSSNLYIHQGPIHKLVICPDNPWEILSVGEDGYICSKDLREENNKVNMLRVMSTKKKSKIVRLFSISHHPFAPEICVSGSDSFVRVYDKRSMKEPVHTMCPEHIQEACTPNVTCCVYNNTGNEILASYSEENIYLFNNKNYVSGEYLHCYKGHYNQKTIKGVNFFGPNCEYIISGSDCGNIFYWDKNTEAILNFMPGDTAGVVNCLEPHPTTPILATSGLDHHIKIWTPSAEKHPPDLTKLTQCVRRNLRRTVMDEALEFDNSQLQYFIRQILCRHRNRNRNRANRDPNRQDGSDDDDDESDSSSPLDLESENDDSDDEVSNLRRLNCATQ
ncbi:DDB1- and CUL4-associated factor 8 [Stomoxys calcitrans]|uniref:DDB1- and CUL4-associated factor 8 n=1 Tax=Stomoxys calcitrans TaxID=35570 RepID=UPI0027E2FA9F|nr:DDB1- and CUL4-associated factor 8 [Stomoxys calcitrans]